MPIIDIDGVNAAEDSSYIRAARFAVAETGGRTYMLSGGSGSGIFVTEVAKSGALTHKSRIGTSSDLVDGWEFKDPTFAVHEARNGDTIVYANGNAQYHEVGTTGYREDGVGVLRLNRNGSLDLLQFKDTEVIADPNATVASFGEDPQVMRIGGADALILKQRDTATDPEVEVLKIRRDGTLRDGVTTELEDVRAVSQDKYEAVRVGGDSFVVTHGPFRDGPIRVLKLAGDGTARHVDQVRETEPLIYNRNMGDMETVRIGGATYLYVTETTRGTISGFEMSAKGALTLVEHEVPNTYGSLDRDGWRSAEALVAFEEDGRDFLAAAGYGNGLVVFEVTAGGALTEVDEFTFPESGIRYGYDLGAADVDGEQMLFAAVATGDAMRSFRFLPDGDEHVSGRGRIRGTEADDIVTGSKRSDRITAGDGDDAVIGRSGGDRLYGQAGNDHLSGGAGRDRLFGGDGMDVLRGDAGRDVLKGHGGDDRLLGGSGRDSLNGNDGNDVMDGGAGRDVLRGGEGDDRLGDGSGFDVLIGQAGRDTFVMAADGGRDVIRDFEDGLDRIDFTALGEGVEFPDLSIRQDGRRVRISYEGEVLIVEADGGLDFFQLTTTDLVFDGA